jgi:hypothetical protein
MNFLQLAQRVYLEGGISGTITTTQNQQGEPARVAAWVQSAYQELCTEDPTRWWFLRERRSVLLPAVGQEEYTPAEMGIDDLYTYDTATFRVAVDPRLADETYVFGKRWPEFRDYWRFSARRTTLARPLEVAITPNMNLAFGPLPDQPYYVQFEYVKKAPDLIKDDDVPLVPPEYHMAIVWLALIHYGMFESAPEVVARAEAKYGEMVTRMFVTQTDEIAVGGALC